MDNIDVALQCHNNNYTEDKQFETNNNSELTKHKFVPGMKIDSGLEIFSPQSDESFTNMFPQKEMKNIVNNYSTMNYPAVSNTFTSPVKTWNSMFICKENNPRKVKQKQNSIIELTLDQNDNTSTSIVIYRNDNQELRHINIIDYRKKHVPRRSNTFSNDKRTADTVACDKQKSNSSKTFTVTHVNNSTDNLCLNLSQENSFFNPIINPTPDQISTAARTKKSGTKIGRKFISVFCCRKHLSVSESESEGGEDEDEEEQGPKWRFSFTEFEDITYLNSGSQGSIYTATLEGKTVVLKKVKDSLTGEEINIQNLLALDHRNVITFIGICGESQSCIVMEYCSQGQLFEWLHRDLEIPPGDVSSWAHQICDGMEYLHSNDIIHRDLKSPNILIANEKMLKIIDFEFSKDCSESKVLNSFVGTIAWMAPEVLREEIHSKKVDVWSYGVVLWEMITRKIPYQDIDRMAILYGVAKKDLSLPLCTSIPRELKDLLNKCWDPLPDERPSFQDILANFINYFTSLENLTQEQFTCMQRDWKLEIESQFEEMTRKKISVTETELIWRRTKELNDAKRIKELYKEKLQRVDKLIDQLTKCLEAVDGERKRNDSEWKLLQGIKQSVYPNLANNEYHDVYFSLQCQNGEKNIRIPFEKPHNLVSPSHVSGKKRGSKLHSMDLTSKTAEKIIAVRRKHSANSFFERNFFHTSKLKNDANVNNKVHGKTKLESSEAIVGISIQNSDSLNADKKRKQLENKWKRNSSPGRNAPFSIQPSPNKASLNTDDLNGTVNQSFYGSIESFVNLPDSQQKTSYLHPNTADIQKYHVNVTENLDFDLYPSYCRGLIEESIKEYPCHEECKSKIEEVSEEGQENSIANDNPVFLREISGRANYSNKSHSSVPSTSLDSFTLNSQCQNSLFEKEVATQNLIKQHNFLGQVNFESSTSRDTESPANESSGDIQLSNE